MIKKILYLFFIFITICCGVFAYAMYNFGKTPTTEQETKFKELSYYKDGTFQSPKKLEYLPDNVRNGPAGFVRFIDNSKFAPKDALPKITLTKESFAKTPDDIALYWLGHSAAILEVDKKRLIIDPVFDNAGPLPFIAPRYTSSPIKRSDLPEFDYILITHNHYDHLERKTVQSIKSGKFIVPLGLGTALEGWGINKDRIIELGWDESYESNGLKITATLGVHYTSRSPWDKNKTLWNSYVIKTKDNNIFWGGDTGYSDHFKYIGNTYGPFDFAALEIDGWNTGWPQTHLFPDEVILAAQNLGTKYVLPTHWAVFDLALHPWKESIEMVLDYAKGTNINIMTPIMGEKTIPGKSKTEYWWKNIK